MTEPIELLDHDVKCAQGLFLELPEGLTKLVAELFHRLVLSGLDLRVGISALRARLL